MSGAGSCRDNLDTWLDNLPDKETEETQPMSDTLQEEEEDRMIATAICICHKFIRLHDGTCPVHGFVRKQLEDDSGYCPECKGRPHAPWCSEYRATDEISDEEYQQSSSEHQPAARGGGDEWQRRDDEVFIHRQMTPDELVKYRAKGFKTTDISYTIARFYGDDAEKNAQRTIDAVNQHQSLMAELDALKGDSLALVAERERLREALEAAREHLDFCGYGDNYERERAEESGLPELIDQVLNEVGGIRNASEAGKG